MSDRGERIRAVVSRTPKIIPQANPDARKRQLEEMTHHPPGDLGKGKKEVRFAGN